ncbi:hypothetical protein C2R22_05805 [Salinigranum rubrum]|uniref:Uncharacterized protein n=1 Tax=Salinigranum rubrum TaxID=755307 RepID=A0A2I8VH26_9EURY|nr:hypothetical protein [Salinigranum rubrum]AUV81232.1 hypothetical protein C2R22_05805 [Salinigranum rubrum]
MTLYRVKTVNPGANSKQTTWVRATSRRDAEQFIREQYSRHYVESATPFETAPEDATVHTTTAAKTEDRRPERSEPADFGGGESTGVQDLLGGDDDE